MGSFSATVVVGAGLAGFLIDDLYRTPVLIVAIEFRVIEAPFCSLLIALVTAITVRLVGVCRCRKNDGEDP